MKKTKFSRDLFENFMNELSNTHLEPDDKSLLVANMLSICSFQEQEQFAVLLKKRGFILNLYKNPTPVTTALIPVSTDSGIKLLSIVRNIEPQKGKIALPGGYVDNLETFEQAAARESWEETGLDLDPEKFSLMFSRVTPQNNTLVFCYYTKIVKASEIDMAFSNDEVQKIMLLDIGQEYCFPSHTEAADKFWKNIQTYL